MPKKGDTKSLSIFSSENTDIGNDKKKRYRKQKISWEDHVLGGGVPASQPQTPPELSRLAFMVAACSDATAL